MDPLTELELGFLLIPVAGFAYGAVEEWLNGRGPRAEVIAVDDPAFGGTGTSSRSRRDDLQVVCVPTMVSDRWGLTGRPDELRRLSDGTIIPVEIKSCRSPRSEVPYLSHRAQLLAYCALVVETYGRAPPYGILCYGDGSQVRVPWDARARAEVLERLGRLGRLYLGEMDPSPSKCHTCQFERGCQGARSVGAGG